MRDLSTLVVLGVRFPPGRGGDLVLDRDRRDGAEARFRDAFPDAELAVLATCNRTEVVVSGLSAPDALLAWHVAVGRPVGAGTCLDPGVATFVHHGRDAVRHLCRVACGLDSAILGETEIVGQLRDTFARAEAAGTAGPAIRRAFRAAFAASKAARSSTKIGSAGVGVGATVAALVAAREADGPVVVVGTGGAASSVTRQLVRHRRTVVLGRDEAKATAVAERFGAEAGPLETLDVAVGSAAAVVVTVPGPAPAVAAGLQGAPAGALVIDLGAPATVAPGGRIDLVTLEDVTSRLQRIPDARRAAVPAVEAIIHRIAP